jgi:hypothetical protein
MKSIHARKLSLHTETLRRLTAGQLARVAGGDSSGASAKCYPTTSNACGGSITIIGQTINCDTTVGATIGTVLGGTKK